MRVRSAPFLALALLIAGLAHAEGTKETTVPNIVVPGYMQTKTWSEKGEAFSADRRGEIPPGLEFDALAEMLPEPNVTETNDDEIWLVWEYVRSEGQGHWTPIGQVFSSSVEEGRRLRVQLQDEIVVRWVFEEWGPRRRQRETSEWFFSPQQVEKRAARIRASKEKTMPMQVDYEAEFD
jgi:hypothetical protein